MGSHCVCRLHIVIYHKGDALLLLRLVHIVICHEGNTLLHFCLGTAYVRNCLLQLLRTASHVIIIVPLRLPVCNHQQLK
jgi:hypothetical protein